MPSSQEIARSFCIGTLFLTFKMWLLQDMCTQTLKYMISCSRSTQVMKAQLVEDCSAYGDYRLHTVLQLSRIESSCLLIFIILPETSNSLYRSTLFGMQGTTHRKHFNLHNATQSRAGFATAIPVFGLIH